MALQSKDDDGIRHIRKTVTILRPVDELYEVWRDFERLPEFMKHVESVTVSRPGQSHWVVRAPAGRMVEWDAEVTEDQPNERIGWRSLPGAEVENGGEVVFTPAPAGRGTEVRVSLYYKPPGGTIGAALAKFFGEEPSVQLDEDLYRFKQLMEAGPIVTVNGQPVGGKQLDRDRRREERDADRQVAPALSESRRDEEVRP